MAPRRRVGGPVNNGEVGMGGHRWGWMPLELLVFTAFGQLANVLASIPPWVGGGVSAMLVGLLLRLLDPTLKHFGEKILKRGKRDSKP